jgi:hypothetical protein
MPTNLKAEARDCRGCGASIPEQPSGPGRPREFCTRDCRSQYHRRKEQAEVERQRQEAADARHFDLDKRFHGVREANRRARERQRNREHWARA